MKTPEEILKEMNWTYDSDPGRFELFNGLIKPAMEKYAEQFKILNKHFVSNSLQYKLIGSLYGIGLCVVLLCIYLLANYC